MIATDGVKQVETKKSNEDTKQNQDWDDKVALAEMNECNYVKVINNLHTDSLC